jgi:hypothetical protein
MVALRVAAEWVVAATAQAAVGAEVEAAMVEAAKAVVEGAVAAARAEVGWEAAATAAVATGLERVAAGRGPAGSAVVAGQQASLGARRGGWKAGVGTAEGSVEVAAREADPMAAAGWAEVAKALAARGMVAVATGTEAVARVVGRAGVQPVGGMQEEGKAPAMEVEALGAVAKAPAARGGSMELEMAVAMVVVESGVAAMAEEEVMAMAAVEMAVAATAREVEATAMEGLVGEASVAEWVVETTVAGTQAV